MSLGPAPRIIAASRVAVDTGDRNPARGRTLTASETIDKVESEEHRNTHSKAKSPLTPPSPGRPRFVYTTRVMVNVATARVVSLTDPSAQIGSISCDA